MEQPTWASNGCSAMFAVKRTVAGSGTTLLAQLPYTCHDGMKLRMVVRGISILVGVDTGWSMTVYDSGIAAGQAGFYVQPASGATISSAQIGAIDTVPPNVVASSSVVVAAMPSEVDLRWGATTDDNAGSG